MTALVLTCLALGQDADPTKAAAILKETLGRHPAQQPIESGPNALYVFKFRAPGDGLCPDFPSRSTSLRFGEYVAGNSNPQDSAGFAGVIAAGSTQLRASAGEAGSRSDGVPRGELGASEKTQGRGGSPMQRR